ncbi:MAG: M16 family metallopeptidase [Spirulinaceae cyanobacterium]
MTQVPTHAVRLTNGMRLITTENPAADIVAARLFVRAGARWETQPKAGLSHLLSAVMTKGTVHLSAMDIAQKVESVGASLGTDASADYFVLSLKTVTADFLPMLQLAQEILCQPSLPPEQVALEQQLTLQSIRAQQERPFTIAYERLRQQMYGAHPYGTSILGTAATVATLTPADLRQYHDTYFRPDNVVLSICGQITPEAAIAAVENVFGGWQAPTTPIPTAPTVELPDNSPAQGIAQNTQQSIIMLGYGAASVQQREDYLALKLLNTYLGNGLSSRLFVELREKRGLAYDVSAFYPTRWDRSQFVAYIGTAPDNTATALAGLEHELQRLVQKNLTAAELQTAQNKLLGQYALGKQTNAEIAQLLGWYETIGLGREFDAEFPLAIAAITPDQLHRVACQYLGASPHLTIVGPEAALATVAAIDV